MAVKVKSNLSSNDKFTYDQDEICKMMEDYHNGINRTETMEFMIKSLEGLIKQYASRFRNEKTSFEDLVQSANLEVITRLDEYNPIEKGKFVTPPTYFINWILGSLRTECTEEYRTGHYLKVFKEVKEACITYGIPLEPSEKNIDKISKIIKRSPKSIRKSFECMSIKVSSIDNMQYEDNEFALSPEEAFIKKEKNELFTQVFNLLSDLQKYVFVESELYGKSYDEIVSVVNKHLEDFNLTKPVKISTIEKELVEAICTLQNSPELKHSNLLKRTPLKTSNEEVDKIHEQLEMDDLEAGFKFGVFDNPFETNNDFKDDSKLFVHISSEKIIENKKSDTHISFPCFKNEVV